MGSKHTLDAGRGFAARAILEVAGVAVPYRECRLLPSAKAGLRLRFSLSLRTRRLCVRSRFLSRGPDMVRLDCARSPSANTRLEGKRFVEAVVGAFGRGADLVGGGAAEVVAAGGGAFEGEDLVDILLDGVGELPQVGE